MDKNFGIIDAIIWYDTTPEWVIWLVCDPGGTLIPSLAEQKYEQALLRWCGLSISL